MAEAGYGKQAVEVALKAERVSIHVEALCTIAKALRKRGDKERALATLNQAVEVIEKGPTFGPPISESSDYLLGKVADTLAELGYGKQAVELANRVLYQVSALESIALVLAQAGDCEQALATVKQAVELAQTLDDEQERDRSDFLPFIVSILATNCAGHAPEVARMIKDPADRAHALQISALGLSEAGGEEKALETLTQAVEVAQKIEEAEERLMILQGIAMTLATEPLPGGKKNDLRVPARQLPPLPLTSWRGKKNVPHRPARRMKRNFKPEERRLAKQVLEALPGN
jgi:tetratricopeptide (TPR) repeat protein